MLALVLWDKAGKPPWNSAPRVESVGLPMRNNASKTWDSGAWFSSCQRDAGKSETSVVCQPHRFWPKQYAFHGQSNHPSSLDHCTPVEAAAQLGPTTQYTAWDPLPEVLMSALLAVSLLLLLVNKQDTPNMCQMQQDSKIVSFFKHTRPTRPELHHISWRPRPCLWQQHRPSACPRHPTLLLR
jgi:hypothetical protein